MNEFYEQNYIGSDVTISNEELSKMNFNINSMQIYETIINKSAEIDNHPKNINIHIPWSIHPHDCFGNDLSKGDKVVYVTTYYDDRFEKMCQGTIIGCTECFIKIKPDKQYINTYQEKEYVLRKYNRVIKL